jgi:transcriptional regulator with XRE-family HTH domain
MATMGKVRKLGGLHGVIAANVRALRKGRGLSQEALAEECGYHRTYVGGIERSERNITIATLEALAGALGVDALALLVPGDGSTKH